MHIHVKVRREHPAGFEMTGSPCWPKKPLFYGWAEQKSISEGTVQRPWQIQNLPADVYYTQMHFGRLFIATWLQSHTPAVRTRFSRLPPYNFAAPYLRFSNLRFFSHTEEIFYKHHMMSQRKGKSLPCIQTVVVSINCIESIRYHTHTHTTCQGWAELKKNERNKHRLLFFFLCFLSFRLSMTSFL